ncbi:hypothetical protein NWP96_07445 [Mycoplasmopsis cynos]|nr:hypothetical protein [Mycoplasmopsis cynos]
MNIDTFKKATKVMSDLFFPIYEAAYVKTEAEFKETVWSKKRNFTRRFKSNIR